MLAVWGTGGKTVRTHSARDIVFPSALRARCRAGLEQTAAVDDEARPRHEVRMGEVENGVGDVVRRADAPEQRLGRPPLLLAGLDCDRPRRDSADANFGGESAG